MGMTVMSVSSIVRKQDLSAARRRLLELCQRLNFGRIENFEVRGGEPHATPNTRVLRECRFPGDNGPRPEAGRSDFALKAQVTELFAEFDRVGNGKVDWIEIRHGLPFRIVFVEDAGF
jgi:hypothetical protein